VRSNGSDLSTTQDKDQVSPANLGETVRDDQRGPPLGGAEDRALDLVLRGAVDGTGCIIQDQDAGVRKERPRECDALPLSAREGHPALRPPCCNLR